MSDIYVYGTIGQPGWWDDPEGFFDAKQMRDGLDEADGDDVTIHVNSGGGDVFEASTMASLVSQYRQRHPRAQVTTIIEGLGASAASYLGLTASRVLVAPSALVMVHDPSGMCYGQAADMRKVADQLDLVRDTIAGIYARKSGRAQSDWLAAMAEETWYDAEQAVESGLADAIDEGMPAIAARIDPRIANTWRHAPESIRDMAGDEGESIDEDEPEDEGEGSGDAPEPEAEAASRAVIVGGAVLVIKAKSSDKE